MVSREESFRMEYRAKPYLRHASDEQFLDHFCSVMKSCIYVNKYNKIAMFPPDSLEWSFVPLFTHALEEAKARGMDIDRCKSHLGDLRGLLREAPCVEGRLADLGLEEGTYFLKYMSAKYAKIALHEGSIRISPASAYGSPHLGRYVGDNEMERITYLCPEDVTIEKGNVRIKPIGAVQRSVKADTDYYVYCATDVHSRRFFHDFDADACLIIHNVPEFTKRLGDAIMAKRPSDCIIVGQVEYYNPFCPPRDINVMFSKPIYYYYQKEARLVSLPEDSVMKLDFLYVDIGPMTDIAELVV